MPAKNVIKTYIANGIYHIYNRGVEKRNIFLDEQDYHVFLQYLKEALSDPKELTIMSKSFTLKGEIFKGIPKQPKNFFGNIDLLAYCLMPNHFHLLLAQKSDHGIDHFMRSIATRYSVFFNKKRKRIGSLFQATYKATLITEESYLLHLTRYIHRNPQKYFENLEDAYSSYGEYLLKRKTRWIKTNTVLSFFTPGKFSFLKHCNSYKQFVEYDKEIDPQYYDESVTLEFDED